MSALTKLMYAFAIIVLVLVAVLALLSFSPSERGVESLPTYSPEEISEPSSQFEQSTSESPARAPTTNTGVMEQLDLLVELLAYVVNASSGVEAYVEVSISASDGYFYIVEARIDSYPEGHPLYSDTIVKFEREVLVQASEKYLLVFEIEVPEELADDWGAGTNHVLYLKIRPFYDVRSIVEYAINFSIQNKTQALKQILRPQPM